MENNIVSIKNRKLYKQILEEIEVIVDKRINEALEHQYDDIPKDLYINHAINPDLIANTWRKIPNNIKKSLKTNSAKVAYICNYISNERFKNFFNDIKITESDKRKYDARIIYTIPPAIGNLMCEADDYSDMIPHKESLSFSAEPKDIELFLKTKYDFDEFGMELSLVNSISGVESLKLIRISTTLPPEELQRFVGVNKINAEMNKKGWYIGTIFNSLKKGISFVQYEPAYYPECTSEIYNSDYLYHITPVRNISDIKTNGLECSNYNQYYAYNAPRLYFTKQNISMSQLIDIAKSLSQQRCESKEFYDSYYVLTIDISKLSNKNIHFYVDPNTYNSVYCYDNIPSNAIISYYKLIDFGIVYNKKSQKWYDKLLNKLKEFFSK